MPLTRLHPRSVGSLPALGGKLTEYRDEVVRGLVLRVTPAGARTFLLSYKRHGRGQRFKLGRVPPLELAAARLEARRLLARIQLGEDPAAARRQGRTPVLSVQQLVERCIASLELRETTRKNYTWMARGRIFPKLGKRPASALERGEVRAWARDVALEAPYSANRALEVLHRSYTWALEQELLQVNPCAGVKAPTQEKERDRVLSTAELTALVQSLEGETSAVTDVVSLLLLTCARLNMVTGMTEDEIEDLDGQNPRWVIPGQRMKADEPHVVPLVRAALAIVRRRLDLPRAGTHLFPDPAHPDRPMAWRPAYGRYIRQAADAEWKKEREDAGPIPKWTIHNLRHTISTHMTEDLGVSVPVTALLLSHADGVGPRITRRYNRATLLPQRRAALVAWAEWLKALRDAERGRVLPHRRAPAHEG